MAGRGALLVALLASCAASSCAAAPKPGAGPEAPPKAGAPAPAGPRCVPRTGRAPPYAREEPGFAADLTYCTNFQKNTCCGRANGDAARLDIRNLALHDAPEGCPETWAQHLSCAACDPKVSAAAAPTKVCRSACDAVFKACAPAFVAPDPATDVLAPCSLERRDVLCSRVSDFVENGVALCREAGFAVVEDGEGECFVGTPEGTKVAPAARSGKKADGKSKDGKGESGKTTAKDKKRRRGWHWAYLKEFRRKYRQLRKRIGVAADVLVALPVLSLVPQLVAYARRRIHRFRRTPARRAAVHAAERRLRDGAERKR